MDAVQSLLSSMEASAAAGEANCPNTSTTSGEQMHQANSEGRTTAIRSTKLVFVYSDEDEGPSGVVQTTAEQVVHPDTLAELQADAAEIQRQEVEAETAKREAEAMPAFSGFTEDLVGEVASVTAAATTAAVELYGPGVRVVATDALGLPRRARLTVHEVPAATGSRKRFRNVEEDDVSVDDGIDVMRVELEDANYIQPVLSADGVTLTAVHSGGYTLTVDERELLEDPDAVEDCAAGEKDLSEATPGASREGMERLINMGTGGDDIVEAVAEDAFDGGWNDFDEEEEEEEEELDHATIIAIVEQLVRCCEAEDLDPNLSIEAGRFLTVAKPQLQALLEEKSITPEEFAAQMDRDLCRFRRIFSAVYRPKDEPIVIDGVRMDM